MTDDEMGDVLIGRDGSVIEVKAGDAREYQAASQAAKDALLAALTADRWEAADMITSSVVREFPECTPYVLSTWVGYLSEALGDAARAGLVVQFLPMPMMNPNSPAASSWGLRMVKAMLARDVDLQPLWDEAATEVETTGVNVGLFVMAVLGVVVRSIQNRKVIVERLRGQQEGGGWG